MDFKWLLLCPLLLFGEVGYVEPWEIEAENTLAAPTLISPPSALAKISEYLILFHQNHLSKTTGPRSHFRPSSSHYTLEAIRSHGFLLGWIMGCDRLMRENSEGWIYKIRLVGEQRYKWDPPPASMSDARRKTPLGKQKCTNSSDSRGNRQDSPQRI